MTWKLVLAVIYFKTLAFIAFGGKNGEMWAKEILDYKKMKDIQGLQERELEITIYANLKSIIVQSGSKELWSTHFPAIRNPEQDRLGRSASVDVLVIKKDSTTPTLMAVRRFMTGQPIESHKLVIFMKSLQKERLGILIGTPDFLKNFHENDSKFFDNIGSRFFPMAGRNDHFIMIWETRDNSSPSGDYKELIKPQKNIIKTEHYLHFLENLHHRGSYAASPVKILTETLLHSVTNITSKSTVAVNLLVPVLDEDFNCPWKKERELEKQAKFCQTFEGYDDLCSCQDPYIPSRKPIPVSIDMKETIPIVIVTANKPYHLYRIFRNLEIVYGAAETPVHVVIDGYQEETIQLCQLFRYDFRLHRPQGKAKDNTRTNMNIGFALWSVFNTYQQYNKAIILEDDLLLSPDLLSYFHQVSHLLDEDPKLSHISAFGQNSYPLTAANLSTILRVEMYPQYGWLTTRKWFNRTSSYWVPTGKGIDWDWWLFNEGIRQDLNSVAPEVSRTGHAGSAGAHVTGFRQFYYFHTRALSTSFHQMPVIDTERISPREKYDEWLDNEIRTSTKIHLTNHPCEYNIFPENETGPFVLFLGVPARDDEYDAFYLMQSCLGTEETDLKEIHCGIMRLNVLPYQKRLERERKRHILYLVGCPMSTLCEKYSNRTTDWIYPSPSLLHNLPNRGFFRKYVEL